MYLTDTSSFDIRNFSDRLEPAKENNKFICPNCQGHNLSIDPNTGEYQCWNGCECKDIREAIKPWDQVLEERNQGNYTPSSKVTPIRRKTKKPQPVPIPTDNISIGTLPNPVTALEIIAAGENLITRYPYSPTQWVNRTDKPNGDKVTIPYHINSNGETVKGKGGDNWQPYRFDEISQYGAGHWVLGVEGEKCTDVARVNYKILSFTFDGSSWGDKPITQNLHLLKNAGVAGVIYWPDHDDTGYNKAKKCSEAAAKVGLPFVVLDPLKIWSECPEKGDIADFADVVAISGDELASLLQAQIKEAAQVQVEESEEFDGDRPGGEDEKLAFNQLAFNALYADSRWICAVDKLYKWEGSYYKLVSDGKEKKRIRNFCNTYFVKQLNPSTGKFVKTYPYAKTANIEEALKWAKAEFIVDIDELNPSGINCLNGILQITWDDSTPSWELIPHNPSYYYTYPPLIEYNPKADPRDCDRLLDALDKPQREIFLKVVAASLDLPNVRRFKGRLIRALLLRGTGSNGKDALRESISTIFGKQGVTSATLNDFAQYDDGRRFPLANLIYSRINWASENTNSSKLDRIQSLKAAITGNPLTAEAKGKDGQEFTPNTVFLFNINDVPNMQGSLEAILSRYGVLDFKKTYKTNADITKGELEADPRFAYDPLFLRLMVCPALLNRLLDALKDLMINGIDYSCTQQALEDIQAENSHLFQFIQDTGLSYDPNSYLSASDIWIKLEAWYQENGTLTYEETSGNKQKAIWQDQVRASDKNIKAVNQVLARIKQLFPKAKLATMPRPDGKKNVPILQGITFTTILNKEISTAISENSTPIPPQFPPQQTLVNQDFHPNHPNSYNSLAEKKLETLPLPQQCTSNDSEKNNSDNLGWLGCDTDTASLSRVDNWGGTGVEDTLIGVENNLLITEPQFKVGDRITCYPTYEHAQKNWKVTATITEIEYQQGYLHHCEVEYTTKNGSQTQTIGGGTAEYILGMA
jgi:putative DNA primase/helicase